ncbi:protein-tyrosine phosphatase-like protein [Sporodiniella umbellata]|nr:protein-tyrosine phosphatase-like protein [Sporodiniella umbellata]
MKLFSTLRFLDNQHKGHYKIFNVRSEKSYNPLDFEHVAFYPTFDHQAPQFDMLVEFCKDAWLWLSEDKENVVAVHCKAGKGRTGTFIASLLLHMGEANCADQAMALYGEKRTFDTNGVTIPSQRRYVRYYEFMLNNQALYIQNRALRLNWDYMTISYFHYQGVFTLKIDCDSQVIYKETSLNIRTEAELNRTTIELKELPTISGDIKLECIDKKGRILFSFWLNTTFVSVQDNNQIILEKKDVDLAFQKKEFDSRFSLQLNFLDV